MYLKEMNITTEEYKAKTEKVHTAILPVGSFEQVVSILNKKIISWENDGLYGNIKGKK